MAKLRLRILKVQAAPLQVVPVKIKKKKTKVAKSKKTDGIRFSTILTFHTYLTATACLRSLIEVSKTRRTASKFMLGMLNDKQKQSRLVACKNLKNETEKDRNFLSKVFLLSEMEI